MSIDVCEPVHLQVCLDGGHCAPAAELVVATISLTEGPGFGSPWKTLTVFFCLPSVAKSANVCSRQKRDEHQRAAGVLSPIRDDFQGVKLGCDGVRS